MIERIVSTYHQFFSRVTTWYQTSDQLTQYAVIVVSGILIVLLSMAMFLSNRTK